MSVLLPYLPSFSSPASLEPHVTCRDVSGCNDFGYMFYDASSFSQVWWGGGTPRVLDLPPVDSHSRLTHTHTYPHIDALLDFIHQRRYKRHVQWYRWWIPLLRPDVQSNGSTIHRTDSATKTTTKTSVAFEANTLFCRMRSQFHNVPLESWN